MIIKDITVKGFWGRAVAQASLFPDVTIFIGLNGTGKTTFLNLIVAVLTVDLFQLSTLQFEEITINLVDTSKKRRRRKIVVTNSQEKSSTSNIYKYKVGSTTYILPLTPDPRFKRVIADRDSFFRFLPSEVRVQYMSLKREISALVGVSQISIYRQTSNENVEIDPRQRTTSVDECLQQLFERFSRYQLKLETQLNERSRLFQQEALGSLLYNKDFDDIQSEKRVRLSEIELDKQEDKLSRAFKELGIEGRSKQISEHINKLRSALTRLTSANKNDPVSAADVFAIPLIYRTNSIIDALNKSEEDKKKIVEPRQKFFETLEEFMSSKKFRYDNERNILFFSLKGSTDEFSWSSLSSGEKQLLIQFMEVLLQEEQSLIFIADEPELSLHVTWQESLLKALRSLNSNAQLIVATHSPDIVADFGRNLIDMQEVIKINV